MLETEHGGAEPLFRALTALPDDGARLRFARVLRELAREEVPLGERAGDGRYVVGLRDLLELPLDSVLGAHTVPEAVAEMRRQLKPRLPGNEAGFVRLCTPDAWVAEATRSLDGHLVWPRTPDGALEHLAVVRRAVQATNERVALVTPDSELRPKIRAMIADELPDVPVLAIDELLDPSEPLTALMDAAGEGKAEVGASA
jgi:hypothetical protein